jgi:MFS family permease
MAVMAPYLRSEFGLSLAETGLLISASLAGSVVSLIPWGFATDRFGERAVLLVGIGGCGLALLACASAGTFGTLALLLLVAGTLGASVQSASGRAVMAAFPLEQRGLALGIRQAAIPISGLLVALALPPITRDFGIGWSFATLGLACLTAATVAAAVLRDVHVHDAGEGVPPLRDVRLWRLAVGSALVIAPQSCVVGFLVLLLHDHRDLTPARAAQVFALVQVIGIAARIAAGRWSDHVGSRLRPLRMIAWAETVLVVVCATLLDAPLALLVPLLVVTGVFAISWNSLSFAAAVEQAGHRRSGVAIGVQQSVLNGFGAVYPGAFGAVVAATSWSWGFGAVAVLPLLGLLVLRALPG